MDRPIRQTASVAASGLASVASHPPPVPLPSQSGRTPLLWASLKGHLPVVEALLAAGASVEARDVVGGWACDVTDCNATPRATSTKPSKSALLRSNACISALVSVSHNTARQPARNMHSS